MMTVSSPPLTSPASAWTERIGWQRNWSWRGWQIRYCFYPANHRSPLPPLLLIHGFGAAIEHWRYNISILAQHTAVYSLDLLGFGGSCKADTRYSAYDWGQQILDFCRYVIGEPAILIGNSIGSLAAVTAAHLDTRWIKGLILVSLPDVSLRQQAAPSLLRPWIEKLEIILAPSWLLSMILKTVRRPVVIQRWAGLAYGERQPNPDHPKVDRELVDIIARPPQDQGAIAAFQQLFHSVRLPGFAPSVTEILPALNCPILLLWGEKDRFIPCRFGQQFAGLNPRLEFELWPLAGHCLHDECPDEFNRRCLQWLQQHFEGKTRQSQTMRQ